MEVSELAGKWFVLYTSNKKERVVREELPFEFVVPMIEKKKVKSKGGERIIMVELEPKYPNYVFVKHDGSPNFFEKCLGHKHVMSFASGDKPLPLTEEEEQNIFTNELDRNLEPDSDVLIVDGPYRGQSGKIIRKEGDRFLIGIKVFNLMVEEYIPEESPIRNAQRIKGSSS